MLKPVELLKIPFPNHSYILLVDNDRYKSEGKPERRGRKFVNDEDEFLVTEPYNGEPGDEGLNPRQGRQGAVVAAIIDKLEHLSNKHK